MERNIAMLMDLYEATMANGILNSPHRDAVAYFDMFFRRVPDDGGYAIMAGLEQLIENLNGFSFSEGDVEYFAGLHLFSDEFLEYLRNFRFRCDVWAVPEGTPIFPGEPIITVRGPIADALLVETMLLMTVNHQSLICTKASRVVRAADGRAVMEFGARRAQGYDAAVYGARAAYIAGCVGTSCVSAGQKFGIPVSGTMAHSWVQAFGDEYAAFKCYAENNPGNCLLLVDTYNTLKSGIPNAIKVFNEVLLPMGYRPKGVRIDSGDIAYLTKKIRRMLDNAGFPDCAICVSNSLDEHLIRDMLAQGASVDSFGVGERLITAASEAVFGGVYKLCAVEENGVVEPRIKISENTEKITTPCFKNLWRLYDRDSGKAIADVITLDDEKIDDSAPYPIFDPDYTWKKKVVTNFQAVPLRKRIFKEGKQVYTPPATADVRRYCLSQMDTLWDEVLRFEKPHRYYVDLSQRLWDEKHAMLERMNAK